MPKLIIALDYNPESLAYKLIDEGFDWFKLRWPAMMELGRLGVSRLADKANLFIDLKLNDIEDSVRNDVRYIWDLGAAAVSTMTPRATEVALEITKGTKLKVWQLMALTDGSWVGEQRNKIADGVICPASMSPIYMNAGVDDIDVVVPGIRLPSTTVELDCHKSIASPRFVRATHIVVGRPITQASNPIAMARRYQEIADGNTN